METLNPAQRAMVNSEKRWFVEHQMAQEKLAEIYWTVKELIDDDLELIDGAGRDRVNVYYAKLAAIEELIPKELLLKRA